MKTRKKNAPYIKRNDWASQTYLHYTIDPIPLLKVLYPNSQDIEKAYYFILKEINLGRISSFFFPNIIARHKGGWYGEPRNYSFTIMHHYGTNLVQYWDEINKEKIHEIEYDEQVFQINDSLPDSEIDKLESDLDRILGIKSDGSFFNIKTPRLRFNMEGIHVLEHVDFGYYNEKSIAAFPAYEIINFFDEVYMFNGDDAHMKAIKEFPPDLKNKLSESKVLYTLDLRNKVSWRGEREDENSFNSENEYTNKKWANKRQVKLFSDKLRYHEFKNNVVQFVVSKEYFPHNEWREYDD